MFIPGEVIVGFPKTPIETAMISGKKIFINLSIPFQLSLTFVKTFACLTVLKGIGKSPVNGLSGEAL